MLQVIPFRTKLDAPRTTELFVENMLEHSALLPVIFSNKDRIFISHIWKIIPKSLKTKLAPPSTCYLKNDGKMKIVNPEM